MRELTKSFLSLSWAMSMFGLKQAASLFTPGSNATGSFETVTRCTEDQLGPATRSTFRAGDNLQRGLVDLTFALFTFGLWQPGSGRSGWGQGDGGRGWGSGAGQAGSGQQGGGGWQPSGGSGQQGDWQQGGWCYGGGGQQGGWGQGAAGSGPAGGGWTVGGAAAAGADMARGIGNMTAQAVSGGLDLMQQGINTAYQVAGGGSAQQPSGTGGEHPTSWAQTR